MGRIRRTKRFEKDKDHKRLMRNRYCWEWREVYTYMFKVLKNCISSPLIGLIMEYYIIDELEILLPDHTEHQRWCWLKELDCQTIIHHMMMHMYRTKINALNVNRNITFIGLQFAKCA